MEDRAPGVPSAVFIMNRRSLLSVISWYFRWKQIFLLSWLIWKILALARLEYFVQTFWACLVKSKAFAAFFFFSAKTFFFLLHLNPELTRKVSVSIACPVNLHHWGYEKKKLLFQQKSPDFQKIINTFKNCQRQLYKRIHEHSYIKESLEPGVPISADFQIACEWLDLAPTLHPHPQPASRRFTTMEFMVTLLRLDEHVRVQEPGPLWEFGLSGLVWSGLVWSRWLSKPLKTFPSVRAVIACPQSWNVLWGMGGGRSSSGHTLSYRTLC